MAMHASRQSVFAATFLLSCLCATLILSANGSRPEAESIDAVIAQDVIPMPVGQNTKSSSALASSVVLPEFKEQNSNGSSVALLQTLDRGAVMGVSMKLKELLINLAEKFWNEAKKVLDKIGEANGLIAAVQTFFHEFVPFCKGVGDNLINNPFLVTLGPYLGWLSAASDGISLTSLAKDLREGLVDKKCFARQLHSMWAFFTTFASAMCNVASLSPVPLVTVFARIGGGIVFVLQKVVGPILLSAFEPGGQPSCDITSDAVTIECYSKYLIDNIVHPDSNNILQTGSYPLIPASLDREECSEPFEDKCCDSLYIHGFDAEGDVLNRMCKQHMKSFAGKYGTCMQEFQSAAGKATVEAAEKEGCPTSASWKAVFDKWFGCLGEKVQEASVNAKWSNAWSLLTAPMGPMARLSFDDNVLKRCHPDLTLYLQLADPDTPTEDDTNAIKRMQKEIQKAQQKNQDEVDRVNSIVASWSEKK